MSGSAETLFLSRTVTGSRNPKTITLLADTPDFHLTGTDTLDTDTGTVDVQNQAALVSKFALWDDRGGASTGGAADFHGWELPRRVNGWPIRAMRRLVSRFPRAETN